MVSLQEPISSNQGKTITIQEFFENNSEKKRRWEGNKEEEDFENDSKLLKVDHHHHHQDIKFRLGKLSSLDDWKDYLEIQQGQVNLYNTKNQEKSKQTDQERRLDIKGHVISLDLELNLHCDQSGLMNTKMDEENFMNKEHDSSSGKTTIKRCPSWISFEEDQQEMVAAVCMRCHMLVMLCKASPSCPNCKFMHPPDHQSPVNLFKPRVSTLNWKN